MKMLRPRLENGLGFDLKPTADFLLWRKILNFGETQNALVMLAKWKNLNIGNPERA